MSNQNGLVRYSGSDRANHWIVALLFVLAGLSGLALFHPSMYFLTGLFGGGSWARILHPFIGVAMFVLFVGIMFKFWHHNVLNANDVNGLARSAMCSMDITRSCLRWVDTTADKSLRFG